ncbi:P-type DNA transfer ATPase VirB11, partial [Mesorhizobium sp. M7A.F.Ca.ET.027.02.1.1]|uniref:ATPase, T2SS/T4P/T4SS family n=1 Tax=Mesorhizobium sp. M7A.F.Ca.ET.027.02.1.1 TaxID=2496655 RepID=UPI000FD57B28
MNMVKHPVAASGPYAKFPILEMELEPLHELLRQDDVSELSVNRPGEIFVERLGATEMERISDARLTDKWIRNLATLVASSTNQQVNEEKPILSAALPSGERIQFVLPPAAPDGGAISIRKKVIMDMTVDDYAKRGAFEETRMGNELVLSEEETELVELIGGSDPMKFLEHAVKNRVSIVVSGGTSTGKTT